MFAKKPAAREAPAASQAAIDTAWTAAGMFAFFAIIRLAPFVLERLQ